MDDDIRQRLVARIRELKGQTFAGAAREYGVMHPDTNSEENMTDSDMQQFKNLIREELTELKSDMLTAVASLKSDMATAIANIKLQGGAGSKNQNLNKEQQSIADLLHLVAADWCQNQGADKPLEPSDIKAGVKAKDYNLGVKLAEKATWNKMRGWMLEAGVYTERKGKSNADTRYFVGPAISDATDEQVSDGSGAEAFQ